MTIPPQEPQGGFGRGAVSYGVQATTPASFQGPESLTRRQDASSRIAGFAFLLGGPMLLYFGCMLYVLDPELEVAAPLCAAGTLVLILGIAMLRRRTVFDARGIHSRGLLRTVHLPWPDSRAGFMVVVTGGGKGGPVALIEVGAAGHRVRLSAPRLSSSEAKDLRLRLEAEVDGIWAWALDRGYAREAMPVPPARQGADPRLAQAIPPPGAAPRALPVDQALLAREPLILKERPNWHGLIPNVILLVVLCAVALLAVLGPERTPQVFAGVLPEDGTARGSVGFWVLLVVAVGGLSAGLHRILRERTILSRSGLVLAGRRTRRVAWPPSRSYLFVRSWRRLWFTEASAWLLAPSGAVLHVPGTLRWSRNEDRALLAAATMAQTIWDWGLARAVTHDDGSYRPAPDDAIEQERRANDWRIAYLTIGGTQALRSSTRLM